jgi:hypothetical protein
MDSERFDAMIRRLGTTRLTRAAALRGLASGAVLTVVSSVSGELTSEAKSKKRRKSKQRRRAGRVQSERAAQADAGKVAICHFTGSETNPYVVIEISGNAVEKHVANHDDFAINDEDGCCLDSDCTEFENSFCDEDAEGGAQCACAPTDREVACADNCGETVSDGCGGEYACDPCCSEPSTCTNSSQCCDGRICVNPGGGAVPPGSGTCRDSCVVNGGDLEEDECSAATPTQPGQSGSTVGTSALCCNPVHRCTKRLSGAGDIRTQCG